MLKAALREFTLVHVMNAVQRQVAADLWTKSYCIDRQTDGRNTVA